LVTFLTPSLAADNDIAKNILNLFNSAPIRIVFNETNFALHEIPGNKPVLIVSPSENGLYHIHQMNPIASEFPLFANDLVISATTFVFAFFVFLTQFLNSQDSPFSFSDAIERTNLILKAASGDANQLLGLISSDVADAFI
jgi:hypothetical protein